MPDIIVKGSKCGEIRIEAKTKGQKVEFRLYYLNNRVPQFDLDNESKHNFSIAGLNAYFVNIQRNLGRFLDDCVPFETPKIMRELREDLTRSS